MKIKFAGSTKRGAGAGIYEGAGGITGISVEEEGGSVEKEGVGAFDGVTSEVWKIGIRSVKSDIRSVEDRNQVRKRKNTPCLS